MLHRLFLALLAFCLSIPALAAPMSHAPLPPAPVQMASGNHDCHEKTMPAPDQGEHGQRHECIGCIARFDGIAPPLAVLQPVTRPEPARLAAQAPQSASGPDTPPPRA
ncbi:MAG: hypothetical protein ACKOPE_09925 [Novosphingobium sp.]